MNGQRAVVLEKDKRTLTVLTVEGEFRKLRYKGEAEVGEEIPLPSKKRVPAWYFSAGVAAVLLVAFTAIFAWTYQPAIAVTMLSLDINPSLQLTLDQRGEVLELQTLNQDAQELVTDLSLEGEYWKDAVTKIIRQSIDMDYLNSEQAWVVVGFSSLEEKGAKGIKEPEQLTEPKEMDSEGDINKEVITQNIEDTITEQGLAPKVAVYELTPEELNLAKEKELSLGEYALINTAQKVGVKVEPEKVKERKERFRLLEMPEIQEQLYKDKGLGQLGLNIMEQLQKEVNNWDELKSRGLWEKNGVNKSRGANPTLKDMRKWQEGWEGRQDKYFQELRDFYQKNKPLNDKEKSQEKGDFPGNNSYKPNNKDQDTKGDNSNRSNNNSQNHEDWNNIKDRYRYKLKEKRTDIYQKDNHNKRQELFNSRMQNFLIKIPSLAEHLGNAKM